MIPHIPNVEDLAKVLFAADGMNVTKWEDMQEPQGGFVRGHYRKMAQTSIDWLLTPPPEELPRVIVTATLSMVPPPR